MADDAQRDRVRALVREVLNNALPADEKQGETHKAVPVSGLTSVHTAVETSEIHPTPASIVEGSGTTSRFINVAPIAVAPESPVRDESSKSVITEDDLRGLEPGESLKISDHAILTPLAMDIVKERNIEIIRTRSRRGSASLKTIAVGSDHGGFEMKEELKKYLEERGNPVRDFGTNSKDAVDYPDFAHAVATAVANHTADLGIVIDGAGVGSAMTANKVPGVRAAACYTVAVARNSREHNDANVLTLGSGTIDSKTMREIVGAWLSTEIKEARHKKRVSKIEAIERQYLKGK